MTTETKWTSDDDMTFVAIGEGKDKNGKARLNQFEGKYVCSEKRKIKGRLTILHRFDNGKEEVLVFGSGSINHKIAKLPSGTLVRLTYKGMKDVGGDSPMKDIKVEWPRGTVLKGAAQVEDVDDEDVPF